ncbi:Calmodulin-3, partial [Chytriomyces hyalinus]
MPPKPTQQKQQPPPKPGTQNANAAAAAAKPPAKDTTKKGSGGPAQPAKQIPEQSEATNYLQIDPSLMERTGLNSVQLQELIEIFSLVDVDHGGTISTDELGVLMNTLGLHTTQMELEAMVKELDSENTGEIDFESFVGAMTRQLETDITPEELHKAFRTFTIYDGLNDLVTPEHEGCMPRYMLVNILTSFGELDKRLSVSEAEELINSVVAHGTHNVFDFNQFIQ